MLRSSFALKLFLILALLSVLAAVAGEFPWGPA
jgi:hypothetical protein